jgi:hypothetical protein
MKKSGKGKKPEEPDDDVELVETPKSKGKGILGAISKTFKRKQLDRSPEEPLGPSKKPSRSEMVCVDIPLPPRPHYEYKQFDARSSITSLNTSPFGSMGPPMSSTPSLASFDSRTSEKGRNFEAERYRTLYNISQEDLRNQRRQYETEITQLQERHAEKERHLLEISQAESDYLKGLLRGPGEQDDRGEGGSAQRSGSGGSRRR